MIAQVDDLPRVGAVPGIDGTGKNGQNNPALPFDLTEMLLVNESADPSLVQISEGLANFSQRLHAISQTLAREVGFTGRPTRLTPDQFKRVAGMICEVIAAEVSLWPSYLWKGAPTEEQISRIKGLVVEMTNAVAEQFRPFATGEQTALEGKSRTTAYTKNAIEAARDRADDALPKVLETLGVRLSKGALVDLKEHIAEYNSFYSLVMTLKILLNYPDLPGFKELIMLEMPSMMQDISENYKDTYKQLGELLSTKYGSDFANQKGYLEKFLPQGGDSTLIPDIEVVHAAEVAEVAARLGKQAWMVQIFRAFIEGNPKRIRAMAENGEPANPDYNSFAAMVVMQYIENLGYAKELATDLSEQVRLALLATAFGVNKDIVEIFANAQASSEEFVFDEKKVELILISALGSLPSMLNNALPVKACVAPGWFSNCLVDVVAKVSVGLGYVNTNRLLNETIGLFSRLVSADAIEDTVDRIMAVANSPVVLNQDLVRSRVKEALTSAEVD